MKEFCMAHKVAVWLIIFSKVYAYSLYKENIHLLVIFATLGKLDYTLINSNFVFSWYFLQVKGKQSVLFKIIRY